MKREKNEYYVARYSLIPDNQITLSAWRDGYPTKESIFKTWLDELDERNHEERIIENTEYVLYCNCFKENEYILNFCKKITETINEKAEFDIIPKDIDNYEKFFIIINITNQIILIQKNSNFSSSIETQKNRISKVFSEILKQNGLSIEIDFLTQKNNFWKYVKDQSGKLKKLEITLNSPNFLKGVDTVKDFLDDLKNTYNNTSTKVSLDNTNGHLTIPTNNNFLNDAIKYSSSGCGSWKVKTISSAKTYSSEDAAVTKELSIHSLDLHEDNIHQIEAIFNQIDSIDIENISGDDSL